MSQFTLTHIAQLIEMWNLSTRGCRFQSHCRISSMQENFILNAFICDSFEKNDFTEDKTLKTLYIFK